MLGRPKLTKGALDVYQSCNYGLLPIANQLPENPILNAAITEMGLRESSVINRRGCNSSFPPIYTYELPDLTIPVKIAIRERRRRTYFD